MRVPLLGWSMFCATLQMAGLARYVREADAALPFAAYSVNVAMRLSTIAFLLLLGASVVLRARPTGKARGLEPRISAFVGAFLVYAIPFFPRRELSVTAEMVSTLLVLFGSAAAVIALARLGRSFSMMSEARRLVTSGPYRFVRHPLYLAEELAIIGISMQFFSCSDRLRSRGANRLPAAAHAQRRDRPHRKLPGIRRLPAKDRPPAARDLLRLARSRN